MAPVRQRRLRFGVRHTGSSLEEWQGVARQAEALGFATLVVHDHIDKQLAPLPALVSAAAVTSTLRLGTVVLNNDLRHPAILAKEAATVDMLTSGKLELGLGAGWLLADYQQTGLSFDFHCPIAGHGDPGLSHCQSRRDIAPCDQSALPGHSAAYDS